MDDRGIGSWLERRGRTAPDAAAIRSGARVLTYADASTRVTRLAHGLRDLGVRRGDRVAWLGENHPAFLETLFATAKLGAILAPINHRLERSDIEALLARIEPRIAVIGSGAIDATRAAVRHREIVVAGVQAGARSIDDLIADGPEDPIDELVSFDDPCVLMSTSGTTGIPKTVTLSHGNMTWNAINVASIADLRHDDVTIAIAPFFRVGGIGVNVLPVLFLGGCVVVPTDVTPASIVEEIARARVSVGFANPDLLDALERTPRWRDVDLSALRFVMTGGAPVPERLIESFFDRGVALVQGYGLSEAAPLVLLLDQATARSKVGAAGRPPMFTDVAVLDGLGEPCARGVTGELVVRGPNVMVGYWRDREATAAALGDDGWLRTGDAARIDADGDVWIVGRIADAFEANGSTIHPGDVERVLLWHRDVLEAAVVPAPRGASSVPIAVVVVERGSDLTPPDVLAYARSRLEPELAPREIRFADALPRTSVGKLRRDVLIREVARTEAGSTDVDA